MTLYQSNHLPDIKYAHTELITDFRNLVIVGAIFKVEPSNLVQLVHVKDNAVVAKLYFWQYFTICISTHFDWYPIYHMTFNIWLCYFHSKHLIAWWYLTWIKHSTVRIINAINPPFPCISYLNLLHISIFCKTRVCLFAIPNFRNCQSSWWMYADQKGKLKFFSIPLEN